MMGEYADMMIDGSYGSMMRKLEQMDRQASLAEAAERIPDVLLIFRRHSPSLLLATHANFHHWQGRLNGRVLAEWWPTTGRLVVLQRHKERKQFIHDAVLFAHVCVVIAERS